MLLIAARSASSAMISILVPVFEYCRSVEQFKRCRLEIYITSFLRGLVHSSCGGNCGNVFDALDAAFHPAFHVYVLLGW
jgi:hypothetical protein